ncbi:TNF receptor-associated factor 6-like [Glandiceps talaboti]
MCDRLDSGMPTGPGPPVTMEAQFRSQLSLEEPIQGYDIEFLPSLEAKYECPICLMALRDPTQTECGHRFCRACIRRSIRDAGPKCPVDNVPLTEDKVFPDNFAKREILSLIVLCPNHGCQQTFELRMLESHQQDCPYLCQPCPNNCGQHVKRNSIEIHLQKECIRRYVPCPYCFQQYRYHEFHIHDKDCPEYPVKCQYCEIGLKRRQLPHHLENECLRALVECPYQVVGCQQKMERRDLMVHQHENIERHLKLVMDVVRDLRGGMGGDPNLPPQSWQYSSWPASSKKQVLHKPPGTYVPPPSAYSTFSSGNTGAYAMDVPRSDGQRSNEFMESPPSTMASYSAESAALSLEIQTLREKLRNQNGESVIQEQKIRELQGKVANKDRDIRELNNRIQRLESVMSQGVYYWKLDNYSDMQRKAKCGETNVIHSPGFYTGYYGYKLCLRINLNGMGSPHGPYVSLFVHFMQGEWDDLLEWPFSGKITLSILDQSDNPDTRLHMSETLVAKPSLAAFHRPTSNRNHKGFGYMEFAPLVKLESRTYLKNNSLIIKTTVYPTSSSDGQQ